MDIGTFQKELTRLGGLNLRGEPNLRVVDGLREMTFACGRWIPKYRSGVVREKKTRKFRLRNIHTSGVRDCTYGEAKDAFEGKMEGFHSEKYTKIELEIEGLDRFVIEQYFPAEKIKDTPENWDKNRYKLFSPHPEIPERVTDIIGAFPFEGRYELLLVVKEEDGTRFGKKRELGQDVLDEVGRAWARRNDWKQTKSDELVVADYFQEAQRRDEVKEREVAYNINSEMEPHSHRFTDLPRAYLFNPLKSNKRTKHGRAK